MRPAAAKAMVQQARMVNDAPARSGRSPISSGRRSVGGVKNGTGVSSGALLRRAGLSQSGGLPWGSAPKTGGGFRAVRPAGLSQGKGQRALEKPPCLSGFCFRLPQRLLPSADRGRGIDRGAAAEDRRGTLHAVWGLCGNLPRAGDCPGAREGSADPRSPKVPFLRSVHQGVSFRRLGDRQSRISHPDRRKTGQASATGKRAQRDLPVGGGSAGGPKLPSPLSGAQP